MYSTAMLLLLWARPRQTTPNSAVRPISTVKSFDPPMQNLDSVCYVVGRCIYWKVCTMLYLKGHKLWLVGVYIGKCVLFYASRDINCVFICPRL